ncbi:hypothetical protein [Mesobacillus zeae]|uniref:Morphogenesis protein n=1 Tax=Mesobacillus zeae TaxID=1917180 RepID=A0A398B535_9BACI|nr:hypothetical protein [Mesobacillus zeae]RID85025.1 hypothetical protein D1970_10685 [Mesobacillus zeae]
MVRKKAYAKITNSVDNTGRLMKILDELNSHSVEIGIFGEDDSFYAMIANVHEYGMTIKPKSAAALTIPVSPKAYGKSAADFPGIFRPKGTDVLAIPKGKDGFEVLFVLKKSVTIPERSFMRSTFDEKNDEWVRFMQGMVNQVLARKMDVQTLYERLGAKVAADIQEKMTSMKNPANSESTVANKGSSNPLIDTGGLRSRVTWKVVEKNA